VFLMFPKEGSPCLVLIFLFMCFSKLSILMSPKGSFPHGLLLHVPSSKSILMFLEGGGSIFIVFFSCSFMSSLEFFLCSLRVPPFYTFLHSSLMSSPKLFSCS
jgi:hypothetical protein